MGINQADSSDAEQAENQKLLDVLNARNQQLHAQDQKEGLKGLEREEFILLQDALEMEEWPEQARDHLLIRYNALNEERASYRDREEIVHFLLSVVSDNQSYQQMITHRNQGGRRARYGLSSQEKLAILGRHKSEELEGREMDLGTAREKYASRVAAILEAKERKRAGDRIERIRFKENADLAEFLQGRLEELGEIQENNGWVFPHKHLQEEYELLRGLSFRNCACPQRLLPRFATEYRMYLLLTQDYEGPGSASSEIMEREIQDRITTIQDLLLSFSPEIEDSGEFQRVILDPEKERAFRGFRVMPGEEAAREKFRELARKGREIEGDQAAA